MKNYLFGRLLLAGLLVGVCLPLKAADAPAKADAIPTTHDEMIQAMIASVEATSAILEGVKAEADVAGVKEKLTALMRRQFQLGQAMNEMPDPKPEEEADLKKKYEEKMNTATEKLAGHYQRLADVEGFKKMMGEIKAEIEKE